ncbi:MAG TPA: hypothetical protein VFT95_12745 [Micromonosporaceae bacterium]|nr:hypothetical protein [Micromonosporaceae bacterium]
MVIDFYRKDGGPSGASGHHWAALWTYPSSGLMAAVIDAESPWPARRRSRR